MNSVELLLEFPAKNLFFFYFCIISSKSSNENVPKERSPDGDNIPENTETDSKTPKSTSNQDDRKSLNANECNSSDLKPNRINKRCGDILWAENGLKQGLKQSGILNSNAFRLRILS